MGQANAHAVREQEQHIQQLFGDHNGGPLAYCHLMVDQAQDVYLDLVMQHGIDHPDTQAQRRFVAKWRGALDEERAILQASALAAVLQGR